MAKNKEVAYEERVIKLATAIYEKAMKAEGIASILPFYKQPETIRQRYCFLAETDILKELEDKYKDSPNAAELVKNEVKGLKAETPDELIFTTGDGVEIFRLFRNKDSKIDIHISGNTEDRFTAAAVTFLDIVHHLNIKRRNFNFTKAIIYMKQGYKVARFNLEGTTFELKDNKFYYTINNVTQLLSSWACGDVLAEDYYVIDKKKRN